MTYGTVTMLAAFSLQKIPYPLPEIVFYHKAKSNSFDAGI
jgi:hypothetical protein